jgi:hypothetical protein
MTSPRYLPLVASFLLAACGVGSDGPQVIDGSSPEAFEQTMRDARSELGPKDRLKFEAAVTEFRAQVFAEADDRQEYNRLVREGLNGLTAVAIVAKFNQNADKLGNDAADAIFDAKRAVSGR